MNLVAVGDLHIAIKSGIPVDWQEQRYLKFFDHIITKCKELDAILLLAGDVINSTTPSVEETALFYKLMFKLWAAEVRTLMVSGNHETISETGVSILDTLHEKGYDNITYRPSDVVMIDGVGFHLINHDSIHHTKFDKVDGFNMLVSHARCHVNKYITEEINIREFTAGYDLVILGDIHMELEFGESTFYTNTPLNTKFEVKPCTGYLVIKVEPSTNFVDVERVYTHDEFPQLELVRCKADEVEGLTFGSKNFYRLEVSGTRDELRKVTYPDAENVIVKPSVVVTDVIGNLDDEEELSLGCADLLPDLTAHIGTLGFSDEDKQGMIDLLMEVSV